MEKKVFVSKPEGRRDIGRPKLRWLDDVEDDIKTLGIRRWRIKAQDEMSGRLSRGRLRLN
jgi:hypothetical protein